MTKTRILARHLARELGSSETAEIGGAKMGTMERAQTTWTVISSHTGVNKSDVDEDGGQDDYWVEDGH